MPKNSYLEKLKANFKKSVEAKDKSWYRMQASDGKAELFIYDVIGMWGISAESFATSLQDLGEVDEITLHLNTPGGSVFDGMAIYTLLREHSASVTVSIDGLAASAGSVIAMAGDNIRMSGVAQFMIHKPWSLAIGDSNEFRKEADFLDKLQDSILSAYLSRKSVKNELSREDLNQLIEDETWMSAEDAKAFGFIDEIMSYGDDDEDTENSVDVDKLITEVENTFSSPLSVFSYSDKYRNGIPHEIAVAVHRGAQCQSVIGKSETPNQEVREMPKEAKSGSQPTSPEAQDSGKIVAQAREEERQRIAGIRQLGEKHSVPQDVLDKLIEDDNCSVEKAAVEVLNYVAERNTALPPSDVRVDKDAKDKFRNACTTALCVSGGVTSSQTKEAREAVGSGVPRSMQTFARHVLNENGVRNVLSMGNDEVASRFMNFMRNPQNAISISTGDVSNILADTINKALSEGYDRNVATWQRFVRVRPVNDFRDFSSVKVSSFSDIEKILEGAPIPFKSISDKKEKGSVDTYGAAAYVSRQSIVNDDLSALTQMPASMGFSVSFHQNKIVYDLINGGKSNTLEEDSTATFTTGHSNLVDSGSAPTKDALDAMRQAFREQTSLKGEAGDTARQLNLVPRFVVAGPKHEGILEQLLYSPYQPDTSNANSVTYNTYGAGGRTPLEMVIDAYLGSLNADAWYGFVDQMQMPSVTMLALNGNIVPFTRSDESAIGEAQGIKFEIYSDYGVMWDDFRGAYRNDGA